MVNHARTHPGLGARDLTKTPEINRQPQARKWELEDKGGRVCRGDDTFLGDAAVGNAPECL